MDLDKKQTKKTDAKAEKKAAKPEHKDDKKTKKVKKNENDADNEYPVYPYEASIYIDEANGFDIYYDPHYESPYDTSEFDR